METNILLKQNLCSKCKAKTNIGSYGLDSKFLCLECSFTEERLHFDKFDVIDGELISNHPLSSYDESNQRILLIEYASNLFNGISKATFPTIVRFKNQGMTYIGMIRALEWFYVIQKKPISKAKKNIGIVPYVYKDAQDYYALENTRRYNRYQRVIRELKKESIEIIYEKTDIKKNNQIDIELM